MIERLRALPGFEALDDEVLARIVARAPLRTVAPGQVVLAAGGVAETLFACIEGGLAGSDGSALPPVYDAPGLLFGLAAPRDGLAGPAGATLLAVAKPHVFTIAREFPEFVVSLMHRNGMPR
ncbi:putative transcriptional regulator, Crp/Fnr family [Rhizorhabdus wittichii RW1]|uniref:Transcriptional regulator, Crp/Fnr family n=1 Tax=Rhizorhabdus wittichii (strain DSM 6014 / CCUG 31198 / JCM 15750 / NBRC 105917 / EY 4224 / RW1) TaxID=392499 RepID=A0A9J9HA89_RHIWR|nr:putative transcriptional regulator, Crp/Fnr family [Rhizorhabdus wittichii RW1]